MSYSKLLLDPRWQKKRLLILQRDNFKCTKCGNDKLSLHVHHESYKGNPWDIEDSKLHTLCYKCHALEHAKEVEFAPITTNTTARYISTTEAKFKDISPEILKVYDSISELKFNQKTDELKQAKINLNAMCKSENLVIVGAGITYGLA